MNALIDRLNGISDGLAIKAPVEAATTANVILDGIQTIDGVSLMEGDRVLVWKQSDPRQNGIYNMSSGPWQRSLDFDGARDVVRGTTIIVNSGTENGSLAFWVTTPDPIRFDESNITFIARIGLSETQQIIDYAIQTIGDAADDILATAWAATNAADYASRLAATGLNIPAGLTYVRTAGYYAAGDGGGALYKKVVSQPSHAGKFQSADGAWWEIVLGPHGTSVKAFGAKGDGVTDDSVAFQGAFTATKHVRVPFSSAGYIVSGIDVPQGAMLVGERGIYTGAENPTFGAQMSTLIAKAGASYILGLVSFDLGTPIHIEHLRFNGNGTTATAVRCRTSLTPIIGVRLLRLSFYRCYEAIGDEVHATNNVVEFYAEDIQCNVPTNRQIYLRRTGGFISFRSVKIDYTNNTGTITWEGARFEQVAGMELEKFDVVGWGTGTTYQAAAFGVVISASGGSGASVWLSRVLMDSLHGPGIYIDGIYNVQAEFLSAGLCWGNGIELNACNYGALTNVFVYGAKASANAPNTAQGYRLLGCSNISTSNLNIKDVKGHGYVLNNATSCKAMGGIIRDNVGTGILEAGTSNANLNSGMSIVGNTATLTQVGSISATVNYVNNASAYTASTAGAATVP